MPKKKSNYWNTKDVLEYTRIPRSTFYTLFKDELQAHPSTRFNKKGPRRPRYWPATVIDICLSARPPRESKDQNREQDSLPGFLK